MLLLALGMSRVICAHSSVQAGFAFASPWGHSRPQTPCRWSYRAVRVWPAPCLWSYAPLDPIESSCCLSRRPSAVPPDCFLDGCRLSSIAENGLECTRQMSSGRVDKTPVCGLGCLSARKALSLARTIQQPSLDGDGYSLTPAAYAQLPQDVPDVVLHGLGSNMELGSNLLVGRSRRHPAE